MRIGLVMLALLALAGRAWAVPTVRGATGLVVIPSAQLQEGAAFFTTDGKVATAGEKVFSAVEGGVLSRDGRTFYDGKLQVLPDITSEDEWIPGVAVGLRGVSSTNEKRDYYFVLQKKFSYPDVTVVYGMDKMASWKLGHFKSFFGAEVPLFAGFTVLADHEAQLGTTNVGVRWVYNKTFGFYDYLEDARGKGPDAKKNTVGACYQKKF